MPSNLNISDPETRSHVWESGGNMMVSEQTAGPTLFTLLCLLCEVVLDSLGKVPPLPQPIPACIALQYDYFSASLSPTRW